MSILVNIFGTCTLSPSPSQIKQRAYTENVNSLTYPFSPPVFSYVTERQQRDNGSGYPSSQPRTSPGSIYRETRGRTDARHPTALPVVSRVPHQSTFHLRVPEPRKQRKRLTEFACSRSGTFLRPDESIYSSQDVGRLPTTRSLCAPMTSVSD